MEKFTKSRKTSAMGLCGKNGSSLRSLNSLLVLIITTVFLISCDHDDGGVDQPWTTEVERLRSATDAYKDLDVAFGDGYDMEVTGYRTQMGYHYLNAGLLDDQFEIERPEVLIYAHDGAGDLQLVAVEYGIPIADLDNPQPAPEGFTGDDDIWKVDTEFSLWTLHVWTVLENPNGIFTPRNPILP